MKKRRYTTKTISSQTLKRKQRAFFRAAGPALRLMCDFFERLHNIALVIKDAEGRIMYTNPYNARISGWESPADQIGYTSWELYPPDQAAVYGGRDRDVFETGKPIVERLYGFVADRSSAMNCVTVRPIIGLDGKRIGTATVYCRAQEKMKSSAWFNPVRKAVAYLNDHITQSVSIPELAARAHYSENQFRRLFRQLTQLTPSEYIVRMRVNYAKTLLENTDDAITEIAQKSGFYDHAHFIRAFKAATGTTPAKYRRGMV